jgi:hypothetical protein
MAITDAKAVQLSEDSAGCHQSSVVSRNPAEQLRGDPRK